MKSNKSFLELALNKREEKGTLRSLNFSNLIDFSSNDFYGLSRNPSIRDSFATQVLKLNQLGSTGSRLISGNTKMHEDLEHEFASYFKASACVLFNSGYSANLGLLSSVCGKKDIVIVDSKAHASIKDGIRLSTAKYYSFRHNDLVDLEKKLRLNSSQIFVVIESLYSMDGDFAPLKEVLTLCNKYSAKLIVDEAHATGIYGKGGGLSTMLGLESEVFARIYTFGKAFGSNGAVVAGSNNLKAYLINFAKPFIYSTAPSTIQLLHLRISLDYLSRHGEEMFRTLKHNIEVFKAHVDTDSTSQIQPIITGDLNETKSVALRVRESGFEVKAILSPTVPEGLERIRICIHTFNSEKDIVHLARLFQKYKH